tara:strand:+ start:91327 stop:92529 length:1203 start_codon:yes stop_codon:yes gene_type:complete
MNPSSSGWIDKYIFVLGKPATTFSTQNESNFYFALRETGFMYGLSIKTFHSFDNFDLKLTEEEIAKVNFLHALFTTYFQHNPENNYSDCLKSLIDFFKSISIKKHSFLPKMSFNSSDSKKLEHILNLRVEKSKNIKRQNFDRIITNALLYLDILAYKRFLNGEKNLPDYAHQLEHTILQSTFFALREKTEKTKYDTLLLEMFQESEAYSGYFLNPGLGLDSISFENLTYPLEKQYLLDLCCLAVWNDLKLEITEKDFLNKLTLQLKIDKASAAESSSALTDFVLTNARSINLFEHTHPVKQFYKQSTKIVKLLILRNKNRLLKELSQSKELIVLLGKSTYTDLDNTEKEKVKEQMLEVIKAIPSLTIFLLPGGSLLLPLLIKFIPQLLPSAFDDNKIPKK